MNFLSTGLLLFSFKKELTYICLFFVGALLLPIVGVILITNVGINSLSDDLAKGTGENHTVNLYYPTGQLYKTIQVTTTWPLAGVVTLEFGQSDWPYQPLHTGIDIATDIGTPIVAAMSGTVVYSDQISWGYGNHVVIDNGDNITTLYGHLEERDVKVGDKVVVGKTIIGKEGQTGWATGPHLHFEYDLWGVPINPRTFISGNP